ncbi:MAG: hypothetical protein QW040_00455 [Candidatus Aenigmatarchaeota archaeon]
MEVFGLSIQTVVFSIFLPYLFFSLLIYALLRKSSIFGEKTERLNLLLALVISALSISSLYYMGLTTWLPFLATFLTIASFLLVYVYGIGNYALKKVAFYEEEVKGDKKKFEEGVENCKKIWERFESEKDINKKLMLLGEMKNEVEKIKPIAEKLGINLHDYEWYKKYEETMGGIGRSQ